MRQFLLVIISLVTFSVADVHPGLKNAIDKGDMKTAETLVKKIGVKDIYCPKNLSVSDAYKIYGDVFENAPEKIWEHCDPAFIANVSSNACVRSASLCKRVLQQEKTENWTPYLKDVLQSKIYQRTEKRVVQKDTLVKATKQECLQNLIVEKARTMEDLALLEKMYCQENDYTSNYLCPIYYVAILDSVNKYFNQKEKQCKKKPTKTIKKDVEESAVVNTFSHAIETYGLSLAKEMMNPFYFDKEKFDLYKALNQFSTNDDVEKYILATDFINSCTNGGEFNREKFMGELGTMCIVYPKLWTVLNSSQIYKEKGPTGFWADPCEHKGYAPYIDTLLLYFFKTKELAYKKLISTYAEKGFLSDSLTAFFCRLHPGIDQELKKITDIDIIDCNVLNEFSAEYEKCKTNDSNYLWKSSFGNMYACDNKKWRTLHAKESELGICSKEGSLKDNMYCARKIGWIKNKKYMAFKDERDGQFYRAVTIGGQTWMAENLNYKVSNSFCYNDSVKYCEKYGRLYTWSAAIDSVGAFSVGCVGCGRGANCSTKKRIRGVCPKGWHMPQKEEFKILQTTVESVSMLKSNYDWADKKNGTDDYGFGGLPAGHRSFLYRGSDASYYLMGEDWYFWSSSKSDYDNESAYYLGSYYDKFHNGLNTLGMENAHSIRCIKD